jgi:S-DNA-T family DNA segregation ATPase FtsK/SpoIIIE
MLISLLCSRDPDELKLILIDPKRLEFAAYADIAHLLFPIVTDPRKAVPVLKWVVQTMEERYELMAQEGSRTINDFNESVAASDRLPYIVVVIDELADLMMTAGNDVENLLTRLSQMARAAGIHLILATQRPSVDIVTGLIKVNFPSRISFKVTSKIDSRTILDLTGAEKLLGKGDMLFLNATSSILARVHGAYVSDKEINAVIGHIRAQRPPAYLNIEEELSHNQSTLLDADDELYQNVLSYLEETDEVSISMLQRRFRIGYNRSARIIEALESQGKIMPADGAKTRKVIRS